MKITNSTVILAIIGLVVINALVFILLSSFEKLQANKIINRLDKGPKDDIFANIFNLIFKKLNPKDFLSKFINIDKFEANCRIIDEIPNYKSIFMYMVLGVILIIVGLFLLVVNIYFAIPFIIIGGVFLIINQSSVSSEANKKVNLIMKEMDTFLDTLGLLLNIGLNIEQTLKIIGNSLDITLAREIQTITNNVDLGIDTLNNGLNKLATKYNINCLNTLVLIILSSYSKGINIAETLNNKKNDLKAEAVSNILEKAEKSEAILVVPIIFMKLVPAIAFIVIPIFLNMSF